MKTIMSKFIKKPKVMFKDMPDTICNRIYGTVGCLIFFMLCGIIFSIVQITIHYLLIAATISVVGMVMMAVWYYPFAYDKITVLEGTVTHIETHDNELIKYLEKRLFYQLKRVYYRLLLDDGQEIFVLYTNKKCKIDKRIRIYVENSSVIIRDNKYYIDNVHMQEIIN